MQTTKNTQYNSGSVDAAKNANKNGQTQVQPQQPKPGPAQSAVPTATGQQQTANSARNQLAVSSHRQWKCNSCKDINVWDSAVCKTCAVEWTYKGPIKGYGNFSGKGQGRLSFNSGSFLGKGQVWPSSGKGQPGLLQPQWRSEV